MPHSATQRRRRLAALARSAMTAMRCAVVALSAASTAASAASADSTAAAVASADAAAARQGPNGELRLRSDASAASVGGPLAVANALQPGSAAGAGSSALAEVELRHTLRTKLGGMPVSLSGDLLAQHEQSEGGPGRAHGRVAELLAEADFGAWQASAGKKVLGWDVGFGFRPNDFVQQEPRRTLLATTPQGRPLLEIEHFSAESATTLVWVNPQRANSRDDASRGALESALAARWYQRHGALDAHAFGRVGAHTGASVGAALAWVAGDELELHASARALQRRDGWLLDSAAADRPVATNPWQQATLGGAAQWLLGASWTGQRQQSLLVEAWHDGSALPDRAWDAWSRRNAGLAALAVRPGLPPGVIGAAAGNLAWQATPFDATSVRRDNLFVRLAWQPEHWLFWLDALATPADGGRILSAGAQWQGDRLRLNAAWRVYGGAAGSVIAQLPLRSSALLAAAWAF